MQLLTQNRTLIFVLLLLSGLMFGLAQEMAGGTVSAQDKLAQSSLTPLQLAIEEQRRRLNSPDVEERRDAIMRLGSMRHPDASRAALVALNDPFPIVRATATTAVLSLPSGESAALLIPLLSDKDEFVRQEASYALGKSKAALAVAPLADRLITDKADGVRGATAVALGEIGDASAAVYLSQVLAPQLTQPGPGKSGKRKPPENVFVLRAAARSLGQIRSRAGVPALIAVLEQEGADNDLKREAVIALGLIGDPAGTNALRNVVTAGDPHLSLAAHQALRRISQAGPTRP